MTAPSRDDVVALVERYVAAVAAQDVAGAVACFAADARQEDPIGAEPNLGHDQIRAFFTESFSVGFEATLDGPVTVHGAHAAFRFVVEIPAGRTPFRVQIVDLVEVGEDLLFRSLRAVPDSAVLNLS